MKTKIRGGIRYKYCKLHGIWWNTNESPKCPLCKWGRPPKKNTKFSTEKDLDFSKKIFIIVSRQKVKQKHFKKAKQ